MKHLSLFSGIGGLDLAAEWAGFETVLFCEQNPYCQKVLKKHWPNVPIVDDIRSVTHESVSQPIDVISGGFPCQPFSHAGKRRGAADDRFLWPEMLRVIREIKPAWIVAENVPGLLSIDFGMVFERVLSELEHCGYETFPLVYPAAGVGALHKRDRVFIVAHAVGLGRGRRNYGNENGRERALQTPGSSAAEKQETLDDSQSGRRGLREAANIGQTAGNVNALGDADTVCPDVADAATSRLQGRSKGREYDKGNGSGIFAELTGMREQSRRRTTKPGMGGMVDGISPWLDEPSDIKRVATGVKNRVDRLRALGNAVVPQQAYPIFKAIAEMAA